MLSSRDSRRVGLARAISKLGYCSRSRASQLIRDGRVQLNATVRRDPETPVSLLTDRIEIDDQPIAAGRKLYFMLNKPRGLVTTTSDEKGRDTIYSCLPGDLPWVAPVGRLDKASEGLLLLTNDSEWAASVLAPESHLEKTYHVQVGSRVDEAWLNSMMDGVRATDGELLRARAIRVIRHGQRNSWLELVLDEGKNREIRRMLEARGIDVLRLVRIAVGPLTLGNLPKGKVRELTSPEKALIDRVLPAVKAHRGRKWGS